MLLNGNYLICLILCRRGASSGIPASRSLVHCLSYANVPVATLSLGSPVLEQKLLCDVALGVLA